MKTKTKKRNAIKRPVEILLVEDNSGDVVLLKEAFQRSSYPVRLNVLQDGEAVLDHLRRMEDPDPAPKPDLILLDLGLPKKGGHEVLAEIKRNREWSPIPVVVLTSSEGEGDLLKAYRTKVDAYLLKPKQLSHYDELLKYLEEKWLKNICGGEGEQN